MSLPVPEGTLRLSTVHYNLYIHYNTQYTPVDGNVEEVPLLVLPAAVVVLATASATVMAPTVAGKLVLFGEFVACCCWGARLPLSLVLGLLLLLDEGLVLLLAAGVGVGLLPLPVDVESGIAMTEGPVPSPSKLSKSPVTGSLDCCCA